MPPSFLVLFSSRFLWRAWPSTNRLITISNGKTTFFQAVAQIAKRA
jgi:hypothetical protein